MTIKLRVWRQEGPKVAGRFEDHVVEGVSPDMSFLEMLDILNEKLNNEGKMPVTFDNDCREGMAPHALAFSAPESCPPAP